MSEAEWMPELVSHIYWEKKADFLFEHDTYATWHLFAVEDGEFTYRIGDHSGKAASGDIVICPPRIAFHRQTITPLSFHAIAFQFAFDKDFTQLTQLPGQKVHLPPTERLSENFRELRKQQAFHEFQKSVRKQHFFADLWLMMAAHYPQIISQDVTGTNDVLIVRAASYLREHATHSMEIKQVASLHNLTPVQFIRRFHAVYQKNPLQFLTAVRMELACSLLKETNFKLDDIAVRCGYDNGYYLSRLFKQQVGVSPSVYRKQSRY